MERKEAVLRIKEILKRSEDTHNVYTPFELCDEMIGKLPKLNSDMKIMVMFNLEFLYVIREKLGREGINNIWFMTPCDFKKRTAIAMGVNENQVIKYEYNTKQIEDKDMPKFDVVVGNPPYQDSSKIARNSNLWEKILKISFELLAQDGLLLFISPTTWMGPSITQKTEIKNIFINFNLLILNLDCKKYFNVGSTFGYYLIKNNKIYNDTLVQLNNISFRANIQLPFLPTDLNLISLSIINKVFSKNEIRTCNFSTSMRCDELHENGKYTVYYSNEFRLANTLAKNTNIKKIVINKPGYINPRFDNGEYGTTGMNYWMEISENESLFFNSYIQCILFKYILNKSCKYSGYNSLGILTKIPFPILTHNWNDQEIYNYFNLTQEEINYIEFQVK